MTRVAGLTGGIACGKSTVAKILADLGAHMIDADQLAREIVEPGRDAWQEIVSVFGSGILHPDLSLNRGLLRERVFADPSARKQLESITHPRIRRLAQTRIASLVTEGVRAVVYEAPLLFENKIHIWLRPVLLVVCSLETQKARLGTRDGLNDAEIQRHLQAQMPLEEKRRLADFVIENDGTKAELEHRVTEVWRELMTISPARYTFLPTGRREHDPRPE